MTYRAREPMATSRRRPPKSTARQPARPRRRWPWLVAALPALALLYVAVGFLRLPSTRELARLARRPPTQSALMRQRVEQAKGEGRQLAIRWRFVPLARISPFLQHAVILSEDQRFWLHHGIDWGETREVIVESVRSGHLGRGASTLTQQLVKNLYLSEERSILRKLEEWVLATRIEKVLTKRRILELYLNFAEWGDGVFGAEEAARVHFGKSAAELDPAEAAVLTAMLPNPFARDPARPSRELRARSYRIAELMTAAGLVPRTAIRARLAQIVGPRAVIRRAAR